MQYSTPPFPEARISWVGYVKIILLGLLLYFLLIAPAVSLLSMLWIFAFDNETATNITFAVLSVIAVGSLLYGLTQVRHCRAYADEAGVWFDSGLFPWSRGTRGVRWENFDQALYYPTPFSWIARSYTVDLRDRYGHSIKIRNLYNGRDWAGSINDLYGQYR